MPDDAITFLLFGLKTKGSFPSKPKERDVIEGKFSSDGCTCGINFKSYEASTPTGGLL